MDAESGNETFVEQQPDCDKAERLAYNLLERYEIYEPPVQVVEIATKEGLNVFTLPKEKMDDLGISGYLNPIQNKIYVNRADPYVRQRFTIAHELGHWFMGHAKDTQVYGNFVFRSSAKGINRNVWEKEADRFAASLLMPRHFIEKFLKTYPWVTNEDFAGMFGVSLSALEIRRNFLRL
jgi:Zn-dependent peptidase ImmA (M78 family)